MLECLQAFQPLALILIAAVGAWVAIRQMVINQTNLRLKLHEKRYDIFEGVRIFLCDVTRNGRISQESLQILELKTAGAVFLFDETVTDFLKEIIRHSIRAQQLDLAGRQNGPIEQQDRAFHVASQDRVWITLQIDEITRIFGPFLTIEKFNPRAPSRWIRYVTRFFC